MLRTILLVGSLAVGPPLLAQQVPAAESPHVTALANCQGMEESAARLQCFDEAASALVTASRQGEVAVVNREQVRKARRSLFGFPVGDRPFFGGRGDKQEEAEPRELATRLTALSPIGFDRYRFTVEDGSAVWETTESAPFGDPKKGTKVTIRRGTLGSYFVQIGEERWVRARRVR